MDSGAGGLGPNGGAEFGLSPLNNGGLGQAMVQALDNNNQEATRLKMEQNGGGAGVKIKPSKVIC